MEEAIAEARRRADKGVLPPRFILQATVRQMRGFTEPSPNQNPFVTVFAQKIDGIQSMPEARRQMLRAQAEQIVAAQIYPAWKKGVELLESQIARATDEAGLWRFKSGSNAYAYALRRFTTTNLTAEQIHQIGLREVARIESEMDTIFRRPWAIGRSAADTHRHAEEGSRLSTDRTGTRTDHGRREPNPSRRAEAFRGAFRHSAEVARGRTTVPAFFERPMPRPTTTRQRLTARGQARFRFRCDAERMTKYGLRSLVYHETVPGHHFSDCASGREPLTAQISAARSLPRHFRPGGRLGSLCRTAGGGIRLADGDLEGRLGQLDSALFRARRLVVDTGLHAMHWTRQQAIAYGIEASEVDRYVVNPGQACSY